MARRRSIVIERFGEPEILAVRDEESPRVIDGTVRVAVRAAGVNRADILLRTGRYHGATAPARPGLEAAGQVVEVGAGTELRAGDRVVIFGDRAGLYTSEAVVRADAVAPVPDGVSFEQAAALPVNWLTAYYCLHRLIRIEGGETLLVLAAASGVGTAAIQLAAAAGTAVIASARGAEKGALARTLGARASIDYASQDLVDAALAQTGGRGVDGVLDAVGGRQFAQALKALAPFGRVAALANVTLEDSIINTRDFYPKNASIHGFQMSRLFQSGRWDGREAMEGLLAEAAHARLRPVIDRTYRLDEAGHAHARLESRASAGKVLLVP